VRLALEGELARIVLAVLDVNAVVVFRNPVLAALQDDGVEEQMALLTQPIEDFLQRHAGHLNVGRAMVGRCHVIALKRAAGQVVEQRRPITAGDQHRAAEGCRNFARAWPVGEREAPSGSVAYGNVTSAKRARPGLNASIIEALSAR